MSGFTTLREIRSADFTVRIVRYAPLLQMPRHAHEHHGVSAVLAGEVIEEAEHRSVVARAGWVVNKPRGVFHSNRFGPNGATLVSLTLADPAAMPGSRWSWRNEPLALRDTLRLLTPRADSAALTHVLERTETASFAPVNGDWVAMIRETIDQDPSIAVTALARKAGVHPVALARAFRRQCGLSIREYKQQLRIRRAVYLLSATRLSVNQVALECGFTDHRHMCRVFRAQLRWRPGSGRSKA